MMRPLIICLVFVLGVFNIAVPLEIVRAETAAAQPPPSPWQISADQIDYDEQNDAYHARGNVSIMREGRTLTADSVRVNQTTKQAVATGNVRLVSGDSVLSGPQLELDLESETGTLVDGRVFLAPNHLYLSGKRIRKTGTQTYFLEKAEITSCDGPDPDWRLTGSDVEITIEGYGFAKHTAFWAGRVPVLYSPYLIFPVKLKRQTGLLMPVVGYSDRKGTEYTQPFFWAISESRDATVYTHAMTDRGVRTGLEYRYIVNPQTKGAIFVEGFTDQKIDDGIGRNSALYGYGGDSQLRTNDGRYWFRMKHDQEVGLGLSAKLDIDVVSDQDYLREFETSYNGFGATSAYFEKTYGREIDDVNDAVRLNRLNLNRTWDRYTFNADLQWYDDVVKRTNDATDDTLQQLPTATLDGVKGPLGQTPLNYDLAAEYTHFYRIDGDKGQRMDLYPRLYYPMQALGAISIEPSAGLRQTAWAVNLEESNPEDTSQVHYRTIYDFKLTASTELYRIFDFPVAGNDRLKHSMIPEVTYDFVPEQDQSDFPEFDDLDRIGRKNTITYAITNNLIARKAQSRGAAVPSYDYVQFLRFKLSQSFDINKHNENDPEPFSDIAAELDITPGRWIKIDADAQWSIYDQRLETLNNALTVWNTRGDQLSLDYRYTRDSSETAEDGIESITAEGQLNAGVQWTLRARHEHNVYDAQAIESSAGVSYRSQCWGLDFEYTREYNQDEQDNHAFTVTFNFLGLGSFGN